MMQNLRSIGKAVSPLLRTFAVIVVIVMVVYPLLIVGIGQVLFPSHANGSPITWNGTKVGSSLIAQNLSSPKLFHTRNATDSDSGIDPDITPADAYAQVPRVSNATGISATSLVYLIE
jgi:K+-transporting ATPase ATPase C chain